MLNLKTVAACVALSAGCLVGVGCHGDQPTMKTDAYGRPDPSGMSKEQMIAQGDQMIVKGQRMKDQAMQMGPGESKDGTSKNDLATQADEMMRNGRMLTDKAAGM